jgi:hypothetical protein
MSIWVHKYASYKGYEFDQGSSNGLKWYQIITEEGAGDAEDYIEF